MTILLRNGRIFDGKKLHETPQDVLIDGKRIKKIGKIEVQPGMEEITRDLEGRIVCPGFIDLHVHLRDPGQEWREDIPSGALAAAAGGFCTVVAMPNTDPPIDCASLVQYVLEKGKQSHGARVLPSGSVTKGRRGENLAEMAKMAAAGAVFFTDDGSPVRKTGLLQKALLYTHGLGIRIMEHPEDIDLSQGGQVHWGYVSSRSGLKGNPASSEAGDIHRGVLLAEETGSSIHFTHVSTKTGIQAVRQAKNRNVAVSCDVTCHHLVMDENAVVESGYDSLYKVNPPLRSAEDREALWEGIADGTVDAIITDHAPYHADEKDLPFQEAPFGIASLECAAAAVLTEWANRGKPCTLEKILSLWTSGPAALLPEQWREMGKISEGSLADITVLDTKIEKTVDPAHWRSKARLSPWSGHELSHWPVMAIVEGKIVFGGTE
ncbi:MAG: dihydroorotase [Thermovirgaceae bacterium]